MGSVMIKWVIRILYIMVFGVLLLVNETVAFAATELVYEDNGELREDKVYRGVVVGCTWLHVRVAPGIDNPNVFVKGKEVWLEAGAEVGIMGKKVSSNGKPWYEVSFLWENTLVVGYVNAEHVKCTTDAITLFASKEGSNSLKETLKEVREWSLAIITILSFLGGCIKFFRSGRIF